MLGGRGWALGGNRTGVPSAGGTRPLPKLNPRPCWHQQVPSDGAHRPRICRHLPPGRNWVSPVSCRSPVILSFFSSLDPVRLLGPLGITAVLSHCDLTVAATPAVRRSRTTDVLVWTTAMESFGARAAALLCSTPRQKSCQLATAGLRSKVTGVGSQRMDRTPRRATRQCAPLGGPK